MAKKSIEQLDVQGKRVLMRVDFNVPIEEGKITDDSRIRKALPTIKYVLDKGGKLILMSHLGRPKGKVVDDLRMDPVAKRLEELLGKPVKKLDDCIGAEVEKAVGEMQQSDVILLENLRFHPEEEAGDEEFARKLASLADVYVSDAFGAAHRAHASTTVVAKFLPSAAGFLLLKEIEYLSRVLQSPEHPFVTILGGAKVSDKIGVIENLMTLSDCFLIGGAMAYTFLKAQGKPVGDSKVEDDKLDEAKKILADAEKKGIKFLLPVDHVVAKEISDDAATEIQEEIKDGYIGLDIGPRTIESFLNELKGAKMVVWNGPLGYFEKAPFREGTTAIARALAESNAVSVIGGGDTAGAIEALNLEDKMSHVSTGGGASLEFLEGKELPGIAALPDA